MDDFTNKYPYTDFHEMNMEYFLNKLQVLEKRCNDLTETVKGFIEYIKGIVGTGVIDDNAVRSDKTYSSQKIVSIIPDPEDLIDDNAASSHTTYSSTKIESILPDPEDLIDDTAASATTVYSSLKTQTELNGKEDASTVITGTLTAGQTSITFSNAAITTTGTFDFYTDVFGVNPADVTVSTGSMTLTFDEQASDISVKVRIS